jgi:hypothetical protein
MAHKTITEQSQSLVNISLGNELNASDLLNAENRVSGLRASAEEEITERSKGLADVVHEHYVQWRWTCIAIQLAGD